jgi:hypothetical protein
MGARWYEGSWAAFLSRDTTFGELSTPISLNRYTYAYASPLDYWDPFGMYAVVADGGYNGGSLYTHPKTKATVKAKTDTQLEQSWMTRANRPTTTATAHAAQTIEVHTARRGRTSSVNHPATIGVGASPTVTTSNRSGSGSFWSNAWDFTKGYAQSLRDAAWSSTKTGFQAMVNPRALVSGMAQSFSNSYDHQGGGWRGGFVAANQMLNPFYPVFDNAKKTINSVATGDWGAAGYAYGNYGVSALQATAFVVAGTPNTARLAQDIAVSPTAPRALPLNRPVGASATQNEFVQSRIASLQEQGATAFRVNQQQVNINSARIGINRPDLQYTLNGQRFYEEFDTLQSSRGATHATRLEANDPFGIINWFTVN